LQILDDAKPGFVEADLVGHDGGNSSGDFIQSLSFVDIEHAGIFLLHGIFPIFYFVNFLIKN